MERAGTQNRGVKAGISALWQAWFGLHFLGTLSFYYLPLRWCFSAQKLEAALWLQRRWAAYLRHVVGIRLQQNGPKPLHSPVVYVANHSNFLDIILAYGLVPDYFHFMAKDSLTKVPLFRILFQNSHIPFDRHNPREAMRAFIRARNDIKAGRSIFIFPEATQNTAAPQLLPFKDGAFRLALATGVPIVPVVFHNNYRLLPYQRKLFARDTWGRPGKAQVSFLPAIDTRMSHCAPETLAEEVRVQMQECLNQGFSKG